MHADTFLSPSTRQVIRNVAQAEGVSFDVVRDRYLANRQRELDLQAARHARAVGNGKLGAAARRARQELTEEV